ncbi:hypothetical protein C3L29_016015 [Pseudomonas sp. MWU12-2534b]|nr:hypothetical protein C3L29_016015 [Pseudomonas sp. MWU12-2534b]
MARSKSSTPSACAPSPACRRWLASEGARQTAFAGKPAPTKSRAMLQPAVGAGLPAKRPARPPSPAASSYEPR